jgi:hypothetical protein
MFLSQIFEFPKLLNLGADVQGFHGMYFLRR